MRDKADAYWRKETGEPLPDEAWLIVSAEIESRQPNPVVTEPIEYPDEKAIAEADGKVTAEELSAMTRPALREYAAKLGIETGTFSKKADIITAITAKPEVR